MPRSIKILAITACLFLCSVLSAQESHRYDVFHPIAKYIRQGDAEALSAWFADNVEITVLSPKSEASRAQARQIVKEFFYTNKPRSFEITHKAGQGNIKYALGNLNAGGENFVVTVIIGSRGGYYKIQQFKIEVME